MCSLSGHNNLGNDLFSRHIAPHLHIFFMNFQLTASAYYRLYDFFSCIIEPSCSFPIVGLALEHGVGGYLNAFWGIRLEKFELGLVEWTGPRTSHKG
jgi:hypothetical protein